MISLGDALLKLGVDKTGFDSAMKDVESSVKTAMDKVQTHLKAVGVAFTAVGVAGVKLVSDAKKLNAQLAQTGVTVGVSTREMRALALQTTEVSFPLKSVAATFEILSRAGVKSTEQLKANANAFDALADAIGSSAEAVADTLIPSYKLFGIELPKTTAELDKFTWLVKNTTVDLNEFSQAMAYVARSGNASKLTLDDMVAIMAALEERGITGTAATMNFRMAVTAAAEGEVTLAQALGLTSEEIASKLKLVQNLSGVTDQYAEAANSQFSIMDKLRQKWSELTFRLGTYLTPFDAVLTGAAALGPLFLILSNSVARATAMWIAHTVAVLAAKAAYLGFGTVLGPLPAILAAVGIAAYAANKSLDNLEKKHEDYVVRLASSEYDRFSASLERQGRLSEQDAETLSHHADAIYWNYRSQGQWLESMQFGLKVQEQMTKARGADSELVQKWGRYIAVSRSQVTDLTEAVKDLSTEEKDLAESTKKVEDAALGLAENALDRATSEYERAVDTAAGFEDQVESLSETLDRQRSALSYVDSEIADAVDAYETAEDAVKGFQDAIDEVNGSLREATSEESKITNELNKAKLARLDTAIAIDAQIEALERGRADFQLQGFDPTAMIRDLEAQKDALSGPIDELQVQLDRARLEGSIAEYDSNVAGLNSKLGELTTKLGEAQADMAIKAETIESWETYRSTVSELYNETSIQMEQLTTYINDQVAAAEENVTTAQRVKDAISAMVDTSKTKIDELEKKLAGTWDSFITQGNAAKTLLDSILMGGATPSLAVPSVALPGHASGNFPIPEPTVLYGLRSMRPYGVAGEAGQEYIMNRNQAGGYRSATIILELDGRVIAQAVGEPLVDEIRMRQGLRL